MSMQIEELLPCAHCNSSRVWTDYIERENGLGRKDYYATVRCIDCTAAVGSQTYFSTKEQAKEAAWTKWNIRAANHTCTEVMTVPKNMGETNFKAFGYTCSECGYANTAHFQNFCPNCGARVLKEESTENVG